MALIDLLGRIDVLKKELDGLKPVSPEREKLLWEKFRLEWNFNSNHIEGNTLTYSETQLFFLHDKTTGDHDMREYEEMRAHDAAIHLIRSWAEEKEREISEAEIRELNKVILVKPFWKEAITADKQPTRRLIKVGEYKEHPNSVILPSGNMFEYASPEETPRLMAELVAWYRTSEIKNAIILAAELHYRYIRIHPFDDGNGRIARLLVNYVLMKNDFPPVIIKSAEKEKYLTALRKADAGDREAFHEYMAEQLTWSLELAIKAAKGESIEEPEDIDKKIALLERELANVDSNNEIKKELSPSVFLEVVNSWIIDLAKVWTKEALKFTKFFSKSHLHFTCSAIGASFVSDENISNEKIDEHFQSYPNMIRSNFNDHRCEIAFNADYQTFLKGSVNTFNTTSHINIKFHKSKYQITYYKFEEGKWQAITMIERLLHHNLSKEEQSDLVRNFANSIINYISFMTKQNGIL